MKHRREEHHRKRRRYNSLPQTVGPTIPLSDLAHRTDLEKAPVVYYISDITPESLVEIYNALGWTSKGNVAVKLSTGEPPASNCLRHELIKNLVQMVNGTIIECNTRIWWFSCSHGSPLSGGKKIRFYRYCEFSDFG